MEVRKYFNWHSEEVQLTFWRSSSEVKNKFNWSSDGVQLKFKRSSTEVQKKFNWSSEEVQLKFRRSSTEVQNKFCYVLLLKFSEKTTYISLKVIHIIPWFYYLLHLYQRGSTASKALWLIYNKMSSYSYILSHLRQPFLFWKIILFRTTILILDNHLANTMSSYS